ncbi:MAG: beta-ribofuranosylaminobenzene 5'-phosphate synthase [Candidatus Hodarchaeota archaeon]
MKIKLTTPSRLHFSLIDLSGDLGRVDGGIGVALNYPNVILEASSLPNNDIIVNNGYNSELIYDFAKTVFKHLEIDGGIDFNLLSSIPRHVGLGSKTQLSLAVAFAINYIFNKGKTVFELAKIVKRGGTSGIGVNVFQKGGFILDAGHTFGKNKQKNSFLPSRASDAPPPPALLHYMVPENWQFVIALPNIRDEIEGLKEINVFQNTCPISKEEVGAVSRLILMVLLPGLHEKDIEVFGNGLSELQNVGFKKQEVNIQPTIIKELIQFMADNGAYGSGISSFGCTTYGLVEGIENAKKLEQKTKEFLNKNGGGKVFITNINNKGMKFQILT